MPCSFKNRIKYSRGIRRSWEPGMRYPRRRPESNHLLTVRGATLQILATCPVVKTFFISGLHFSTAIPGSGAEGTPCLRACAGSANQGHDLQGNFRGSEAQADAGDRLG